MFRFNIISTYEKPIIFWFNDKAKEIYNLKKEIDEDNNLERWEVAKKFVNPHELVYSPYDSLQNSILLKKNVLSRAYYKFLEIIINLNLHKIFKSKIQTLHLAEGPGGFIQAWDDMRLKIGFQDNIYGITLKDNKSKGIKGWYYNRAIFKKKEIIVDSGEDGTGDLFKQINITSIIRKYKNSASIITGDGGFDFSTDFLGQEANALPLLFIQSYLAIHCQKENGFFILKVFDILNVPTIQLIEFISKSYSEFFIIKPNTSRCANSEKYIVFVGYKNLDRNLTIKWNNLLKMMLCFWNKLRKLQIQKSKQWVDKYFTHLF
jgi:23S rRNA U2552 (ribose-2'-O)-methylase RlmE/FtsJ